MCKLIIDHYTHKDCDHKHLVRTSCEENNLTVCESPQAKTITWYIHTLAKCSVCRDRDQEEGKDDGHDSDDEECECSTCGGAILVRRIDSRDGRSRSRSSRTKRREILSAASRSQARLTGQPFSLTTRNGRRPSRESREALAEKLEEQIAQGASVSKRTSRQSRSRGSIRDSMDVSFEVEDVQEDQELKEGLHELMKTARKANEHVESRRSNSESEGQIDLEDGEIDEEGAFESMTDIGDRRHRRHRRPSWRNIPYSDRTGRLQWMIDSE